MSFLRLKESGCRWAVGGDGDHPASGQFATIPKGRKNTKKRASGKSFPKSSFRAEMEPVLRGAVKASMAVCGESQLQTGKNIF